MEIFFQKNGNPTAHVSSTMCTFFKFQLLQAQLTETKSKLADIEQKDKDKSFTQTWQESATPETQDPIGRVVARLECPMVEDAQEVYVSFSEGAEGSGQRR